MGICNHRVEHREKEVKDKPEDNRNVDNCESKLREKKYQILKETLN